MYTTKKGKARYSKVKTIRIGTNDLFLLAAYSAAKKRGEVSSFAGLVKKAVKLYIVSKGLSVGFSEEEKYIDAKVKLEVAARELILAEKGYKQANITPKSKDVQRLIWSYNTGELDGTEDKAEISDEQDTR